MHISALIKTIKKRRKTLGINQILFNIRYDRKSARSLQRRRYTIIRQMQAA